MELVQCVVPKAKDVDVDANESIGADMNGVAPNHFFDMAVNCIPSQTDACHESSLAKDEIG